MSTLCTSYFVLPVPCKRPGVWLKELFSKLCSRKKKLAMAECVGGAVFVSSGTAQSQSAQHYYRPMERKASGETRVAGQKGIVSIPLARHVHSGKMCAACPLVSCRCTSLLLLHFCVLVSCCSRIKLQGAVRCMPRMVAPRAVFCTLAAGALLLPFLVRSQCALVSN